MGAIVFALIESRTYGWWRQDTGAISPVPVALVGGVALMVAFVALQRARRRAGRVVLVDLRLLGIRSFRYGSIAALIVALGEFGLIFTLPLLLQNALGYSALGTGWLIVSLAVGTFLVSGATPELTAALGGRTVVRIGLALEAVAVGGLALTLHRDDRLVGDRGVAVRLRRGSRDGHRPAHQRHPRRGPGRRVGPGLGPAEHVPPARLRPGCGGSGHPAADHARSVDGREAHRRRCAGRRARPGGAGRDGFGRVRDPGAAGRPDDGARGRCGGRGDDQREPDHHRGGAAVVIALGLAATWALPFVAPPERRQRSSRSRRRAAA